MSMDPGAEAVLDDLRKEVDEAKSEMMKWKTLYNKERKSAKSARSSQCSTPRVTPTTPEPGTIEAEDDEYLLAEASHNPALDSSQHSQQMRGHDRGGDAEFEGSRLAAMGEYLLWSKTSAESAAMPSHPLRHSAAGATAAAAAAGLSGVEEMRVWAMWDKEKKQMQQEIETLKHTIATQRESSAEELNCHNTRIYLLETNQAASETQIQQQLPAAMARVEALESTVASQQHHIAADFEHVKQTIEASNQQHHLYFEQLQHSLTRLSHHLIPPSPAAAQPESPQPDQQMSSMSEQTRNVPSQSSPEQLAEMATASSMAIASSHSSRVPQLIMPSMIASPDSDNWLLQQLMSTEQPGTSPARRRPSADIMQSPAAVRRSDLMKSPVRRSAASPVSDVFLYDFFYH